jgi:hypothetical protein
MEDEMSDWMIRWTDGKSDGRMENEMGGWRTR